MLNNPHNLSKLLPRGSQSSSNVFTATYMIKKYVTKHLRQKEMYAYKLLINESVRRPRFAPVDRHSRQRDQFICNISYD
jgi:hypothetical protein